MSSGVVRTSSLRARPNDKALDTAVQQLCNHYLPEKTSDGGNTDLRRRTSDEQFAQILASYYETPQTELQHTLSLARPVQPFLSHGGTSLQRSRSLILTDTEYIHTHPEIITRRDTTVTRKAPPQPFPAGSVNADVKDQQLMHQYPHPPQHQHQPQYLPQYQQQPQYQPLPQYQQPLQYQQQPPYIQQPSSPPQQSPVEYTTLHPVDQEYNREYHPIHTSIIPRTEPQTRRSLRPPVTGISPIRPHKFPRDLPQAPPLPHPSILHPHPHILMPIMHKPIHNTFKSSSPTQLTASYASEAPRHRTNEHRVKFNEIVTVIPAPENHIHELKTVTFADNLPGSTLDGHEEDDDDNDDDDDDGDGGGHMIDGMSPMNEKDAVMGVKYGYLIEDRIRDYDCDDDDHEDNEPAHFRGASEVSADLDFGDLPPSAIVNAGLRGLSRSQSYSVAYRRDSSRNVCYDSQLAIDISEVEERSAKGGKIGKSLKKIGRWFT